MYLIQNSRKEYQNFRLNICRCQANLRCKWQRRHFLTVRRQLAAERDERWAQADIRKVTSLQHIFYSKNRTALKKISDKIRAISKT